MEPPTVTQQMALAYAPIPFAAVSFLSSSFVIYYLLFRERHLLQRVDHRLVLAMNVALLPVTYTYAWSTAAMPEGTPNFVGTKGTVNTCTAAGVLALVFGLATSTYYASLVLQAFLGIRNNFKEENYRWIEMIIHLVAYLIPCSFAAIVVATENFNPSGTTCWVRKAPLGCDDNPDVECERGKDIRLLRSIIGISQISLYFIYPPAVILAMYLWMRKTSKKASRRCSGMSIIRETARKEMMRSVHRQTSVYLLAFWSTWVLSLVRALHQQLTGTILYNLAILANCIFALQGFVFMVVYFTLQNMGRRWRRNFSPIAASPPVRSPSELTVSEIRSNVHRKSGNRVEQSCNANDDSQTFDFNIFDGEPDPDSPWVMFFAQSDASEEEGALGKGGQDLPNGEMELANEQSGS